MRTSVWHENAEPVDGRPRRHQGVEGMTQQHGRHTGCKHHCASTRGKEEHRAQGAYAIHRLKGRQQADKSVPIPQWRVIIQSRARRRRTTEVLAGSYETLGAARREPQTDGPNLPACRRALGGAQGQQCVAVHDSMRPQRWQQGGEQNVSAVL
jgi:hypothetical protein